MYIQNITLEGFKSYGKRIEINGFDREFNAITGLNGSGKSNILDAICFVLGISNLGHVRASSLQELVYKSGQAGIKKASVTITFDNRNKTNSPLGYEDYDTITVTRQVVIDGKNKYMINGSNVQNKRVQDMFCSVQLNVNNPHFLIMQGRITKVLNMKPHEILSMIEEAAGTKMYESKKISSLKLIEKKDSKLKEINEILKDELGPKIEKLKQEREKFMEYQRVDRQLQHCQKIYTAWKYVNAKEQSRNADRNVEEIKEKVRGMEQSITDAQTEAGKIDEKVEEIRRKKEAEQGTQMSELEEGLRNAEKKEHKLSAEINSNKERIKAEEKSLKQLQKNLKDDEKLLADKSKEMENVGGLFEELKEQERRDSEALVEAQETYQKISSGLLQCDDGTNATLEQQLINAKKTLSEAQTEFMQCQMKLSHNEQMLQKKKPQLKNTDSTYAIDKKKLEELQRDLAKLEGNLQNMNYEEGHIERLQEERQNLMRSVRELNNEVDRFEGNYPQLRFSYQDPEPNFRRESVKGLVCKSISVREPEKFAYALEMAAGGRLYNVMVDSEQTGKKLLQRGQLQSRVTFIPLNKISGHSLDQQTVRLAQSLVGADNVWPALSLIDYPQEVQKAMTWVFGQVFICTDMNVAKKVAFHKNILKKCITLEGDVFDPSGVLSGGANTRGGSILTELSKLKDAQDRLQQREAILNQKNHEINEIQQIAQRFAAAKKQYDIKNHELQMVSQRLQQTSHHQLRQEVEQLEASLVELKQKMTQAKETEENSSKKAKELEAQLKDADNIRKKQLKNAEKNLETLKKRSEESKQKWQQRERESQSLSLEIQELQKTIETGKEQLAKLDENLKKLKERAEELQNELNEVNKEVQQKQKEIRARKDAINQHNQEIQKLMTKKDNLIKHGQETELEIKKLNHEITAIKATAKDCKSRVQELLNKHEWIAQDEQYFGEKGGVYDFDANNPQIMGQQVNELQNTLQKLSRMVNTRAMMHLNQEEEQYNELLKKRKILENDKKKILESIKKLDEKKRMTLLEAWERVNKDFGSIFSTLLPGADAKLEPPENQTVLEGLEVKVCLCGVWKESLGELSGGQRSLIALSLILAMLLFKPAPLYILDEVDAALDLSHTENIGIMLKRHFKHSQFIVVSLKNGMFNNANVLFKTKFVDGMSTVQRTEKPRSR